tara:strand:+ start:606 stop:1574 length:969 start_codon:yes stop_codon:yes gene_type:complete
MKKILTSVLFALIFSISIFYAFNEVFPPSKASDISDDVFFLEQSNTKSKKILMLGGSGAAQLNSTIINEWLNNEYENSSFFNLAYNADTPKQRYNSINETLSLNPELILYAITYYDLNGYSWEIQKENIQPLPEIDLNPSNLIFDENDPFSSINPKETTLNFIRDSFSGSELFPSKRDRFELENSPFSHFDDYQTKIANDKNLKEITSQFVKNRVNQDPSLTSEQLSYLNDIINLIQKQDIPFVLIILPQQEYFLNLVPEKDEILFQNSLTALKDEFNIKIIDMSRNYENLNIWQDHNHVAFNTKSKIFSEDVYKIIIDELN